MGRGSVRTLMVLAKCDSSSTRVERVRVWWSFVAAASATAFLSVAAAGEVAGAVESMGLVSILAAAEAAASDAMDCGLILDGVIDTCRRRTHCRLNIEGCSTAVAGPMSDNMTCARQGRGRVSTGAPGAGRVGCGWCRGRAVGGCARRGGIDSRSGAENAPGAMPQQSLAEDAAPACVAREKRLPQQRAAHLEHEEHFAKKRRERLPKGAERCR